ncbi:hypothetical protein BH18ACT17_BH18ACT17_12860 [soil metagenome]
MAGAQGHASGASKLERRIERIEVPEAPRERWTLHMDLAPATRGSDVAVRLVAAVVERGSFRLVPLDLEIARGDRIALIGANGSGKSTLLHAIAGTLDLSEGSRALGPSVVASVLDQDRDPFVPRDDLLSMLARETGPASPGRSSCPDGPTACALLPSLRRIGEARPGQLGVGSMRERAEMAGGGCATFSLPGAGSTLEVWLQRLRPEVATMPSESLVLTHEERPA